jgi:hypothetical protein
MERERARESGLVFDPVLADSQSTIGDSFMRWLEEWGGIEGETGERTFASGERIRCLFPFWDGRLNGISLLPVFGFCFF